MEEVKSKTYIVVIIVALIIFVVGGYFLYTKFVSGVGTQEKKNEEVEIVDLTNFVDAKPLDSDMEVPDFVNPVHISSKEYEVDGNKLIIKFYQAEISMNYDEEEDEETDNDDSYFGSVYIDIDNNGRTILKNFEIDYADSRDYYNIDKAENFLNNNLKVFSDYNGKKYLQIKSINTGGNTISIINPDDGRRLFYFIITDSGQGERIWGDVSKKYNIDLNEYFKKESYDGKGNVFSYLTVIDNKLVFREIRIKDTKVIVRNTEIKEVSEDDDMTNVYVSIE